MQYLEIPTLGGRFAGAIITIAAIDPNPLQQTEMVSRHYRHGGPDIPQ